MFETNSNKSMKNLIYFTIGNNPEYIKLAQLCLNSLKIQGYKTDILFITDRSYKDILEKNIYWSEGEVNFLIIDNQTNLTTSSSNKLKIYQYKNIDKYDNIICSDTDVLWTDDPSKIFNLITDNKIYISNDNKEFNMSHKYWGGDILTAQEKQEIDSLSIIGLNAGLFAFRSSMICHIEKIDQFFYTNYHLVNECLEQPFINTYLFREKIYSLLPDGMICHQGYNHTNKKFYGVVLHFAGGPGNYQHKMNTMINYYNRFLLGDNVHELSNTQK